MSDRDDVLSASQLRQRYQKGGELRDDQLTAAQLRSRYGLQSNSKNFSTSEFEKRKGDRFFFIVLFILGIICLLFFFFYYYYYS